MFVVPPDYIQLYRNLRKAQAAFDIIVECIDDEDYQNAKMIAQSINLGVVPVTTNIKDVNAS